MADQIETQVLAADDRRVEAMRKEDWPALSEMHVENAGTEQRFTVRCLAAYAKAGETWRMIAWQSTRVPEA
jgi:hypothetical protein